MNFKQIEALMERLEEIYGSYIQIINMSVIENKVKVIFSYDDPDNGIVEHIENISKCY